MAYFADKAGLAKNPALRKQWDHVLATRNHHYLQANAMAKQAQAAGNHEAFLACNASILPQNFYAEMDAEIKQLMLSAEDFSLLDDLNGLSRNVGIGKIEASYRMYDADEFEVRSSIDGQHAKPVDRGAFKYDGTIVPVHTAGITIPWRELAGMREEGFDIVIDDLRMCVRAVREKMSDVLYNGTAGLTFNSRTSYGIRNSPNVKAFNLTTDGAGTMLGASVDAIRSNFRAAINALRSEGNNANGTVDIYVSPEIWGRMDEIYSLTTGGTTVVTDMRTVYDVCKQLVDIGEIKRDNNLKGDEFVAVIRRSEYIQPVVGMPISTVPIERRTPMDNHQQLVWCAMGLQIKADAKGRTGVLYASIP